MLETLLFTLLTCLSIKFEVVFYDRGIVKYELKDGKSSLVFDSPIDKFECTWDKTVFSPFVRGGGDQLNLDNFTKDPALWSDWLVKSNDDPIGFIYGKNKKCNVYKQNSSHTTKSTKLR